MIIRSQLRAIRQIVTLASCSGAFHRIPFMKERKGINVFFGKVGFGFANVPLGSKYYEMPLPDKIAPLLQMLVKEKAEREGRASGATDRGHPI